MAAPCSCTPRPAPPRPLPTLIYSRAKGPGRRAGAASSARAARTRWRADALTREPCVISTPPSPGLYFARHGRQVHRGRKQWRIASRRRPSRVRSAAAAGTVVNRNNKKAAVRMGTSGPSAPVATTRQMSGRQAQCRHGPACTAGVSPGSVTVSRVACDRGSPGLARLPRPHCGGLSSGLRAPAGGPVRPGQAASGGTSLPLAASLANPDQRFEFREEHGARSLSKKGARASPRRPG